MLEQKDTTDPIRSVCRRCGSAEAEKIKVQATREIDGKKIVWIRVRCIGCGQLRVDRAVV